ncbi:uncharacterized protein [Salminus brasiliensis]|uniref:uncharacterized protein n=1 Tax=Salminus brasiliensis TaxID=930266 RepID=UPI003B832A40
MKIIFLFTLHLISGPVGCFDVIGFPGGEVRITCRYKNSTGAQKSFCKLRTLQKCGKLILTPFGQFNTVVNRSRFSLMDNPAGALTATIRHLSSQDSGLYRCAESGAWSYDVNLVVKEDPCCLRSKTVTGYRGETVTISCSYPEELPTKTKFLYKQYGQLYREVIRSSDSQKDRFSISDDKSSKVVSVRISDVREEDGGVYSCAVGARREPVSYYTRYTEIQLQVSDKSTTQMTTQTSVTDQPEIMSTSTAQYAPGFYIIIIIIIIITVSVCVGLLLIGGLTMSFYKLGCTRTQDSISSDMQTRRNTADENNENDPPQNQNIAVDSVYHNVNLKTNQSDSVYQSLNPNTNQSESVYQSLNPNTNQSDSVYQSLNPNTHQSESVYQSLDPSTNQSDSVYQSLNPNTHQSESVYQSLDPSTNQSDSVYQSLKQPNGSQTSS